MFSCRIRSRRIVVISSSLPLDDVLLHNYVCGIALCYVPYLNASMVPTAVQRPLWRPYWLRMRNAARPIIVLEIMPQQYVIVLAVRQYSAMPIVVGHDIR